MSRLNYGVILAMPLFFPELASGLQVVETPKDTSFVKPNVIILLTDDQGYGDMSCYGRKNLLTPNFDLMAKEGMRCTDFYAGASSSTPSRAALLTGRYAERVGLPSVVDDQATIGLKSTEYTIADFLKQNGYRTGMFGKWHLGHLPEFWPNKHGFTEFFGIMYSNDMWPFHPQPNHAYPPLPLYENERVVEYNPDINNMTTRLTERAVDFINRNAEAPFFLYLPYTQPHVPLGVSDKFKNRSGAGLYADVIMEIDWSVGEILKALDKHGISRNTIVLFTSDNGPWLAYGNHAGSAGALREGKGTTFEGGQRVPLLVRMPGTIPAGMVSNQFLSALDILPTILDLTKTKMPNANPLDGQTVLDAFSGGEVNHKPFFYLNQGSVEAVRWGKWKLIVPHKYRIVLSPGKDGFPGEQAISGGQIGLSLFNLETDPNEKKNLVGDFPEIVESLHRLIGEFSQGLIVE